MELFFQPNLTNEGFKEREEHPLLIRRVEHGTRIFVEKINMIIQKVVHNLEGLLIRRE